MSTSRPNHTQPPSAATGVINRPSTLNTFARPKTLQLEISLTFVEILADTTQVELAKAVQVPQQTVSRWANGTALPNVGQTARLPNGKYAMIIGAMNAWRQRHGYDVYEQRARDVQNVVELNAVRAYARSLQAEMTKLAALLDGVPDERRKGSL